MLKKYNPGENHYDCGLRELLEETGAVSREYSYLGTACPTLTYVTGKIHIYLAKGLTFKNHNNLMTMNSLILLKCLLMRQLDLLWIIEFVMQKLRLLCLKTYLLTQNLNHLK